MNLVFFASRSVPARNRNRFFSTRAEASSATSSLVPFRAKPAPTSQRLVAVWSVNPDTGRIECRWTANNDEIARWLSRPWVERAGLILAAAQQSRFGRAGSFR